MIVRKFVFPMPHILGIAFGCKRCANLCPYIKIKKKLHSFRNTGAYIFIIKSLHMLSSKSTDITILMLVMPTPNLIII